MTRNGDYNLSDSKENQKRSDLANRKRIIFENDPLAVISIHQNSYPSSDVHGAQVFYPQGSEKSKQLADPIVIVECGFLSNPEELKALQNNKYQQKAVKCIVDGIITYINNK